MSVNGSAPRVISVRPSSQGGQPPAARRSYSFQKQPSQEREYHAEMRRTSHSTAPLSSHSISSNSFKRMEDGNRRQHIYEELPFEGSKERQPQQQQGQGQLPNHRFNRTNRDSFESEERQKQMLVDEEHRRRESENLFNESRETDILNDDSEEEDDDIYQAPENDEEAASSSDDPEYAELMERDRIVNLYEKGPDNKDIDAWENPDLDIYYKMDRFGFVHKESENLTEEQKEHRKRVAIELNREKKWLRMIEQWQSGRPSPKMEQRIWKGIPEKLRMTVWPRLLGADVLVRKNQDVYQQLLLRARLVSKDIKQIDLDINRTYRDHLAFRRRYDVKQKSLLNVLAAYSMYNTEVGYCQGMSQIAALLLMYLDEEDAFWCMHALMVSPRHSMHGFFVPGFPKLTRFENHFKKVLKKYKPRIYKHLEKNDIPYIYLTKWWFGCFLDRVPFSLALRLWDVFIIEGDSILIAMALNIMKMHEKTIRTLQIENFMNFVQTTLANNFRYTDDQTMISLRETLSRLRSDRLHKPPPPSGDDLPELPTKQLGPVLSKSLATIRDEITEIQSRKSKSRPNSAYPSPYPTRRKESARLKTNAGSRTNVSRNDSPSRIYGSQNHTYLSRGGEYVNANGPLHHSHHDRHNPMSTSLDVSSFSYSYNSSATPNSTKSHQPSQISQQRQPPYQQQSHPVATSRFSIRDEQTGRMVTVVRASPSEDDSPGSFGSEMARIIHDRDNVTRIEL